MKKIITAINNPKLNEELKKEKNIKIIGKDIQYKEAIIEILEKNNQIDLIIINEKIPGQISLEDLIKKIKITNETIKIIFILEKENKEVESVLIKNNIFDIYYNNKINLKDLVKIINEQEINMQKEIIKLKKIIEEKNKSKKTQIKKEIIKKIKNKVLNKKKIKESNETIRTPKIITFSGNNKSGKSTLSLIIGQVLADYNYKVLLIDADLEKRDLSIILNQIKNKKHHTIKRKKISSIKKESSDNKKKLTKKKSIIYYKIKNYILFYTKTISKNFYFFGTREKNKKEERRLKKYINIFSEIIKLNYDFIIIELSKNNRKIINKEVVKKSDINFIVMEPDLLGIREVKKILNQYIKKWEIEKKNISVITNKTNFNSINKKIIAKSLFLENRIYEIKENNHYRNFMNKYLKRKMIINDKNIKKEIEKIVKQKIFSK